MAFPSIYGLTQPVGDISVLRAVLNQHWRVLVQDFLSLQATDESHQRVDAMVRDLLKHDPRRAVRILRRPTSASLVGCIRRKHSPALLQELDQLIVGELEGRTETAATHFEVIGGIKFATTDNNPLLAVQAHPDRAGNSVDLGGHPVAEWVDSLRAAFAIIAKYQPLIAEEMRLGLELLIPVGWDSERHFSVSFEEAVGAIYLTLHPNVMTMAEAMIHEFQHNKLNAVFRWDPVLRNAHSPLYTSPVRPDPRPLHGVLMAAHAFQPVATLYERMTAAKDPLTLGHDWKKRFKQIIEINREGAETVLRHGEPTAVGEGLLHEMREIDDYFRRYSLDTE